MYSSIILSHTINNSSMDFNLQSFLHLAPESVDVNKSSAVTAVQKQQRAVLPTDFFVKLSICFHKMPLLVAR